MINSANGCHKDMLIFCIFKCYFLCLASHNANQFLPLLFQRKRIQPMVVIKICLYFASLSVHFLCLASHNADQFLPLLFQRKRTADIYILALILHAVS